MSKTNAYVLMREYGADGAEPEAIFDRVKDLEAYVAAQPNGWTDLWYTGARLNPLAKSRVAAR